jgi:hypothetical protein
VESYLSPQAPNLRRFKTHSDSVLISMFDIDRDCRRQHQVGIILVWRPVKRMADKLANGAFSVCDTYTNRGHMRADFAHAHLDQFERPSCL